MKNILKVSFTILYFTIIFLITSCAEKEKQHEKKKQHEMETNMQLDPKLPKKSPSIFVPKGAIIKLKDPQKIASKLIIVDGHIDLPYRIEKEYFKSGQKHIGEDLSQLTSGNFDFKRAAMGGLNAPFMSIYVPAKYQKLGGAKQYAMDLIKMVRHIIAKYPNLCDSALNPQMVIDNFLNNKISLPLGIENGAAIEDNLDNVNFFFDQGVRYITLTHSKDNLICDSSYDSKHTHNGLSKFGESVVERMNQVGIMIDVAHISDSAFYQVMALSKAPVIASHSSCRHFTPNFERNMSDDMIQLLAKKEGVIMINFGSKFLDKSVTIKNTSRNVLRKQFITKNNIDPESAKGKKQLQSWSLKHPKAYASVQDVANHIDHVVQLVGIDHVGLGSDFDGVEDTLPTGLKSVSDYPNLIDALLKMGYSVSDLNKITSGNVFRVWNAVQEYAEKSKETSH